MSEQMRPHLLDHIPREVLSSRVEWQNNRRPVDGLDVLCPRVFFPHEHLVVVFFFEPLAERRLYHREVQHAPDFVEPLDWRYLEVKAVVVPMQVAAFAFMADDAVPARNVVVPIGRHPRCFHAFTVTGLPDGRT